MYICTEVRINHVYNTFLKSSGFPLPNTTSKSVASDYLLGANNHVYAVSIDSTRIIYLGSTAYNDIK